MAAAVLLTSCAGQPGSVGAGLPPDDGTDACRPQAVELDRSGAFFAAPIIAGVAVVGAGGVLGTRPGIIGGLVFLTTSAAAAAAAAVSGGYLEQRQREAGGDNAALATAVATDIERENAGLATSQQALDGLLECRLRQANEVQAAARAGELQRQQAEQRLAELRAQAERDLQLSRAIEARIQARAAELDPAVNVVAPGAEAAARARPPAATARAARPVRLQVAPVASAPPAPAPQVAASQPVQVRPARTPGFVAVETPAGERLGYAPESVFTISAPARTRAIAMPAAASAADAATPDRLRTLASSNIARRDNFREAVADLGRAVSGGGFELGT